MTEQTMTVNQLNTGNRISTGKQIQPVKVPMSAARRAEIDAVLEVRLRQLLAARGEDLGGQFPQVADGYPLTGRLWLFGTAYRLFLDTRSAELKQDLRTEGLDNFIRNPQTRGGRAFQRCLGLLYRLIYRHGVENGLLCTGPL